MKQLDRTTTQILKSAVALLTVCMVLDGLPSRAQAADGDASRLVYNRIQDDGPPVRVDGISRSGTAGAPALYVLADDMVGYTIRGQPALYWFQSGPTKYVTEVGIYADGANGMDFSTTVTSNGDCGICRFNLADHNITLSPGVRYSWYVALVPAAADHSGDIVAQGVIERIAPPERIAVNLLRKSKKELVYLFAEAGIWYDALEFVSELIERDPADTHLREVRAELLEQGNLSEVARFERRQQAMLKQSEN